MQPDENMKAVLASCAQLAEHLTAVMDEELSLDADEPRKLLLADLADVRGPMGPAVANLHLYTLTGVDVFRDGHQALMPGIRSAWDRVDGASGLFTATQAEAFGKCRGIWPDFLAKLDAVQAHSRHSAPHARYRAVEAVVAEVTDLAQSLLRDLTAIMKVERHQAATPERKKLLADLAGTRGPVGLAMASLREYLIAGAPTAKYQSLRFLGRAKAGFLGLHAARGMLTADQQKAFISLEAGFSTIDQVVERALRAGRSAILAENTGGVSLRLVLCVLAVLPVMVFVIGCTELWRHGGAFGVVLVMASALAMAGSVVLWRQVLLPLRNLAGGNGPGAGPRLAEVQALSVLFQADGAERHHVRALLDQYEDSSRTMLQKRRQAVLAAADRMRNVLDSFTTRLMGTMALVDDHATALASSAEDNLRQAQAAMDMLKDANAALTGMAEALHQAEMGAQDVENRISSVSGLLHDARPHVENTNIALEAFVEASLQVSDVAERIRTLTRHTNGLAMNAMVEAVRSTEAGGGAGFKVVATEVRELSAAATVATRSIDGQLLTIRAAGSQSVAAVHTISDMMDGATQAAELAASGSVAQAQVTRSVAGDAQATARTVADADGAMGGIVRTLRHARTMSDELQDAAHALRAEFDQFASQTTDWLTAMRTS